ncbi:MAG: hypothetical protein AAGD25_13730 [Cyanobacteria bacterium P01_F01_bin.150]
MTGFIRGLFSKNNADGAQAPKSKEAFFLEPDAAKTFGDIDYMREMKTVEHKFPNGKRKTQVRKISSVDYLKMDDQVASRGTNFTTTPSKPASSFSTSQTSFGQAKSSFSAPKASASNDSKPKAQETEKRRPASDTSMDMFRSMAKNIRK